MSEIRAICYAERYLYISKKGELMRGRKPEALHLNANDIFQLRQTARSQSLPWYQVRRARIVLAIAEGQRVQQVAAQMQCAARTVRRTCCRYQDGGLHQLLAGPQQPGRPLRISPPCSGPKSSNWLVWNR